MNRSIGSFTTLVLVLQLAFSAPSSAAEGFEVVLLPLAPRPAVAGAAGSQWRTEVKVHNDGPGAVSLFWGTPHCVITCVGSRGIPPGITIDLLDEGDIYSPAPAILLYLKQADASSTWFSARVWDMSRETLTAGTKVPVVRAGELLTGRVALPHLPTGSIFRIMARLYAPNLEQTTSARLRLIDSATNAVVAEQVQLLTPVLHASASHPFNHQPAYQEVTELFRDLEPDRSLRLEVEFPAGVKYWVLVSVTNNITQQVTLVYPD